MHIARSMHFFASSHSARSSIVSSSTSARTQRSSFWRIVISRSNNQRFIHCANVSAAFRNPLIRGGVYKSPIYDVVSPFTMQDVKCKFRRLLRKQALLDQSHAGLLPYPTGTKRENSKGHQPLPLLCGRLIRNKSLDTFTVYRLISLKVSWSKSPGYCRFALINPVFVRFETLFTNV